MIEQQIERVYAAIGVSIETDFTAIPMRVTTNRTGEKIQQRIEPDFNGGKSQGELANELILIVHNLARLEYHLKQWAAHNGKPTADVDDVFQNSRDLQIVHDLWNSDKHTYSPTRNKGRSGINPQIGRIYRVMCLKSGPQGGSVGVMFPINGRSAYSTGGGSVSFKLTAELLDSTGQFIEEVDGVLSRAVNDCEQLMRNFGLLAPLTAPNSPE